MANRKNIAFWVLFMLGCLFCESLVAQQKMTRQEYINLYKDISIQKMQEYKIPASITLAQGILESGCGCSYLATAANNHFGIKCHKEWSGPAIYYDDDAKGECFRLYKTPEDSFNDHSLFLTSRSRYNDLFLLDILDYKAWAHGLKQAGYATNPKYPELLIKIIEEENLHQFDLAGISGENLAVTPIISNATINTNVAAPTSKRDVRRAKRVAELVVDVYIPNYQEIRKLSSGRIVYSNNDILFVFAKEGDTYQRIADDFGIYSYQLYNYNEKPKVALPATGEMVYLERKKKSGVTDYYLVQPNETMRDIAQKMGMTTKALYQKNRMDEGTQAAIGTVLWITKKR